MTGSAVKAGPGEGGPDRYAVIGHPVAHSQSPFIQAMFAAQVGHGLIYDRIDSPPDAFADTVRRFALDVGSGRARGCNVTVPFKFEAWSLAARHTERALLAGAANTLCFDGIDAGAASRQANEQACATGWLADNTDGAGLVRDIECNAGVTLAGRRVLVIGAGGAAAGALGPLIEAGPRQLHLLNRTADKAHELARRHAALAERAGVTLRAGGLDAADAGFDVVVNASASSLGGGDIPVRPQVLARGALALDMMYGPAARPFLTWAEQHGAVARDGLGMLVEQAAEAFTLWRGVSPETAPVLAAMRQRLDAATR